MRQKAANILIGILLIALGVAYVGDIFDIWSFTLFFDGWWTLFLIVPALYLMIKNGFNVGSIIMLGIGVLLFFEQQEFIKKYDVWKLIFPLVVICIGISLIFKGFGKKGWNSAPAVSDDGKAVAYTAVFGECNPDFTDVEFTGANTTAVFGGVTLDLRRALINSDCVINTSSIFGGTDIYLPPNVNMKLKSTPIFGGVDDCSIKSAEEGAPVVYIDATCIFGGADIK